MGTDLAATTDIALAELSGQCSGGSALVGGQRNSERDVGHRAAIKFHVLFDNGNEELTSTDADLPEVVRLLCAMAAFAGLVGRIADRDQALEVAAGILSEGARSSLRAPRLQQ